MSGAASYVPLQELEDAIGTSAALRLLSAFGGSRLYVPAYIPPGHAIERAIGLEAAEALARHIATGVGGLTIELPRGPGGAAAEHRRRLMAAAAGNRSEREIAQDLQVHGRTVRRARAKLREAEDAKQGRLF